MRVVAVTLIIGIAALITNITSPSQLSGQADVLLTVRLTLSNLVNSGTVWGGLLLLAGWLVQRPVQAALAGMLAGEFALIIHYALGQLFGIYEAAIWPENWHWFVIALTAGPILGLMGAAARRGDVWGLLFRLVVPVAAIAEPVVLGMFAVPDFWSTPGKVASIVAGIVLIVGGAVGVVLLWRHWVRPAQPATST